MYKKKGFRSSLSFTKSSTKFGQKTAISQRPVVPKSLELNLEAKGIKAKAPLNQGEPMWNLELFTWSVTVGNWSWLPSTISFRSGEIVCVKSVFVSCLLVSCHEKILCRILPVFFTCEILLPGFWMFLFHQFQCKIATLQRRFGFLAGATKPPSKLLS